MITLFLRLFAALLPALLICPAEGSAQSRNDLDIAAIDGLTEESTDEEWTAAFAAYAGNGGRLNPVIRKLDLVATADRYALSVRLDSLLGSHLTVTEMYELYLNWGFLFQSSYEASLHYFLKCVRTAESLGREELLFMDYPDGSSVCLWYLIGALYRMDVGAIDAYRRYAELAERRYSPNSPQTLHAYLCLMSAYRLSAHMPRKAIAIGDSIIDRTTMPDSALLEIYYQKGLAHCEAMEWEEACGCLHKSLSVAPGRKDSTRIMQALLLPLDELGRDAEVRNIIAFQGLTPETGKPPFEIFRELENLAALQDDQAKALEYYERAEAWIGRMMDDPQAGNVRHDKEYFVIRHYYDKASAQISRYKKLKDLRSAVEAFREYHMQDSMLLGELLLEVTRTYFEIHDLESAEMALRQALHLLKGLPPTNERWIRALEIAAKLARNLGDYGQALQLRATVAQLRAASHGRQHIYYRLALIPLFSGMLDQGRTEDADSCMREFEQTMPTPPTEYDRYILGCMQARLHIARKDYDKAYPCILEARRHEDGMEDNGTLDRLLKLTYKGMEDWERYKECVIRETHARKERICERYYGMTARERQLQEYELEDDLSHLLEDAALGQSVVDEAFDYSLFAKGLQLRTQKAIEKILGKEDMEAYSAYLNLKRELNKAVADGDSALARNLNAAVAWREMEMADALQAVDEVKKALLVDKDDVLRALPEHAVAVDFVRYLKAVDADGRPVDDPKTEPRDFRFRYGAFCVSHSHPQPAFVDLGWEADLTQGLERDDHGDLTAAALRGCFGSSAKSLYTMVWEPLEEALAGYDEVFFCGTELLNRLPIEFLKDKEQRVMADKVRLHRVFSLTELKTACGMGSEVAAFGVADHHSPARTLPAALRGKMGDLPQVRTEMEKIAASLKPRPDVTLQVWLDDEATEPQFKRLSGTPVHTLHIASHAFYLSNSQLELLAADGNDPARFAADRLLRAGRTDCSAILLRGGNDTWNSPTLAEGEDDILTAEEIEDMDFPALNLVVLSACRTGVGASDTEGLWGLPRAFRKAGTRSLICTTRQVNSAYAEEFMASLYSLMAEGMTVYDAFTQTRQGLAKLHPRAYDLTTAFMLIE